MPSPPPTLPEELLEEVFLRLPPDEPACLVRTSLASKFWLGLLTSPAFRGRYRERHGAPPMLGFLLSWISFLDRKEHPAPLFVSTAKFGARIPDKSRSGQKRYEPLDCRHGRVLLAGTSVGSRELAVWDPMTGCRRELAAPVDLVGVGAAVLCAVAGCEHRACHEGPFRVLLFGLNLGSVHAWACSSETEQWSQLCSPLHLRSVFAGIHPRPSLLFENALYHIILYRDHIAILKYDMGSNCMSLLDAPPLAESITQLPILMTLEDGSLGFTYVDCFTLYRWSRQIRSDGVATWSQCIVVDLKELLPIQNPKNEFRLVGFKDSGIIFVTTDLGIYEINLISLEWKKIWRGAKIRALIPYMSFYNPPERATTPSQTTH